jgi:hypothetical protein
MSEPTEKQLAEYRLEILRDRNRIEMDIARSLGRLLALLESIVEHSPWAMQILAGVYRERALREEDLKKNG